MPGKNARSDWQVSDRAFLELTASIEEHGILEPLLVRERAATARPGRRQFELIAGFRRYHAARLLGLSRVPVRVLAASDEEVLAVMLSENLARKDLSEADALSTVAQLQETYRWGVRQIARMSGRSAGWVSELLTVAQSREEREAVISGQLTLNAAARLVRLKRAFPDLRDALLARVAAGESLQANDVPRVQDLESAVLPVSTGPAIETLQPTDADTSLPDTVDEAASLEPRKPAPVLELEPRDLALVRNTHLLLRQMLSTLAGIRAQQGREHVLPAATRDELEQAMEELSSFLAMERRLLTG